MTLYANPVSPFISTKAEQTVYQVSMRVGKQFFFAMITKVYDGHEKVTNYCYIVNNDT